MFKEDVEQLPPPEDMYEHSVDGMDHDAGAKPSLEEGLLLDKIDKPTFRTMIGIVQHARQRYRWSVAICAPRARKATARP